MSPQVNPTTIDGRAEGTHYVLDAKGRRRLVDKDGKRLDNKQTNPTRQTGFYRDRNNVIVAEIRIAKEWAKENKHGFTKNLLEGMSPFSKKKFLANGGTEEQSRLLRVEAEAQSASGGGNTQPVPEQTAGAPIIVKQPPAPRLTPQERGFLIKTGHRKPTGYKPTPNSNLDGVERTESNKTNGLVDHSDIYFGKKVFQYQNTCPTCGNNCDDKWVKSTVNGEIKRVRLEKEHKDANRENNSQENIDAKCNICNQKAKQNGKFDGNSDPLLATAVSEQWKYWEDAVLPAEFRKWLNDNNKQIIR